MTLEEALEIFHIKPPTTTNALRTKYRALAKLEHPDTSKHPDKTKRFQNVNEAYKVLSADKSIIENWGEVTTTVTGQKLADLGKGLGPTTNGATCEECSGFGYRAAHGFDPCPDCREFGFGDYRFRCKKCRGSGKFTRNGVVVGKCFPCNGAGWIRPSGFGLALGLAVCQTCNGRGAVERKTKSYYFCTKCEGKGELPMWNPVLPRGLLNLVAPSAGGNK